MKKTLVLLVTVLFCVQSTMITTYSADQTETGSKRVTATVVQQVGNSAPTVAILNPADHLADLYLAEGENYDIQFTVQDLEETTLIVSAHPEAGSEDLIGVIRNENSNTSDTDLPLNIGTPNTKTVTFRYIAPDFGLNPGEPYSYPVTITANDGSEVDNKVINIIVYGE